MSGELQQWGQNTSTTTGLTFGYFGGTTFTPTTGAIAHTSNGTIAVANNTINYVERLYDGTVQTNTTAFSANAIGIAKVTTSGGAITAVEDWRPELGPPPLFATVSGEVGVMDWAYPPGHALRYGLVGDGTFDNATRAQNWLDSCVTANGAPGRFAAYLPAGRYKTTAPIMINNTRLHLYGDDRESSVFTYNGVGGGCLVAATGVAGKYTFNDFGILGDASSGIAIDLTGINSGSDPEVYLSTFERLVIIAGQQAFKANSIFSSALRDFYGSSFNNHAFQFRVNICTIMESLYAGSCGAGKAGYRLTGSIRMYGCNGLNQNDGYWGVFGSRTSGVPGFGTITISGGAGVGTFSVSQAGVVSEAQSIAVGKTLIVNGVGYVVAAFNGTTGVTLTGAPNVAAASFGIANGFEGDFPDVPNDYPDIHLVSCNLENWGRSAIVTVEGYQNFIVEGGLVVRNRADDFHSWFRAYGQSLGTSVTSIELNGIRPFVSTADPVVGAAGTLTVSGGTGACTFSTSQAGIVANGKTVVFGGNLYTVSSFNGSTGATLTDVNGSPAPNTSATIFGVGRAGQMMMDGIGRVTITGGAGAATFSASQTGKLVAGQRVSIAGIEYTVAGALGGGGTTATLTGAPNVSAVAFKVPGYAMINGNGTVTITGGSGAATFSASQTGVLDAGQQISIAGVEYTVSGPLGGGGTTATLPGAPNTGAVAFKVPSYPVYSDVGANSVVLRNDLTHIPGVYRADVPGVWSAIKEAFRQDVYGEWARDISAISPRRLTARTLRYEELPATGSIYTGAAPVSTVNNPYVDVTGYTLFRTANTAATSITNFPFVGNTFVGAGDDSGRNGQLIIHVEDSFTTFKHLYLPNSATYTLALLGARDYKASPGDVLVFELGIYDGANTGWIQTAGAHTPSVKSSGTGAAAGTASLTAGTVVVSTTAATSSCLVFLQRVTASGTIGDLTYTTTPGSSFTITSANAGDTSTVAWWVVQKT